MNDFLIVIPAYNESMNISSVLDSIDNLKLNIDVLVVNDGSLDNTEEIVMKKGHKIISLPINLGYGMACQTGFKYAVQKEYKYVIQFDGDGQHSPEDIPVLMETLYKGNCDIVIGTRFLSEKSFKIGTLKKIAIGILKFFIKISTGQKITDPSSGFQGLNNKAFSYYSIKNNYPEDFPDADVIINMLQHGFTIKEVPATFLEREAGESMHSGLKPIYYFAKMTLSIFIIVIRNKLNKVGAKNAK